MLKNLHKLPGLAIIQPSYLPRTMFKQLIRLLKKKYRQSFYSLDFLILKTQVFSTKGKNSRMGRGAGTPSSSRLRLGQGARFLQTTIKKNPLLTKLPRFIRFYFGKVIIPL